MLTTQHLHEKDKEVRIKTSLSLKGQVNEQQLKMGYYHTTQWLFHPM